MATRRDKAVLAYQERYALKQGKAQTLSLKGGGYIRVHPQGSKWAATESGSGGLKGGSMLFGSRREAMAYARRRQAVVERKGRQ